MADVYFRPDGQNRFQIRSAANGTLPSSWLDQEFNRIYTYLNTIEGGGTSNAGAEWTTVNAEFTQVNSTSFYVMGDYSALFEKWRAIRITDSSNVSALSHVKSAVYVEGTNITTITVFDQIVPEEIETIDLGLISDSASAIPSVSYSTITSSPYTVAANAQIILADDSTVGNLTQVWDDNYLGTSASDGAYQALLINLPSAGDMSGKLLCVKKIAGTYTTIVSAPFTHSQTTEGTSIRNTNTYSFQIYGDTAAKNRVTLKGIGDCYCFVSNGIRWYELTPEASETVKGIVRFATENEMSVNENNDSLSRTLAISPYQADREYMRTNAENMKFAANFIYKAPNGVAELINNSIVIKSGLGLNIPNGRDANGNLQSTKLELTQNVTFTAGSINSSKKLLFLEYRDNNIYTHPIEARNYLKAYLGSGPLIPFTAVNGEEIIWYDYNSNVLRLSTDRGTNWTTFNACGPLCCFWGNGVYITDMYAYGALGFVTREDLQDNVSHVIYSYRNGRNWVRVWSDGNMEQGGLSVAGSRVNFLLPYGDINTVSVVGVNTTSAAKGGFRCAVPITSIFTTGFDTHIGWGDEGGINLNQDAIYWYANGY